MLFRSSLFVVPDKEPQTETQTAVDRPRVILISLLLVGMELYRLLVLSSVDRDHWIYTLVTSLTVLGFVGMGAYALMALAARVLAFIRGFAKRIGSLVRIAVLVGGLVFLGSLLVSAPAWALILLLFLCVRR